MLLDFFIAFVVFDLIILVVIIIYKIKKNRLTKAQIIYFQNQWQNIIENKNTHPDHAVLEADKLVDQVLKIHGFKGTFGDKLKQHPHLFSDLNGLWKAHKLRNKIAHEVNFKASQRQMETSLKSFRTALKDLGIET